MTSGLVDECRDIKGCNIIKIMSYIRIMGKPYDKANNYFRKYFMSYPAVCFLSLSFLLFFLLQFVLLMYTVYYVYVYIVLFMTEIKTKRNE